MDQVYWGILEQVITIVISVLLPVLLGYVTVIIKRVGGGWLKKIEVEIGVENYALLQSMVEQAVLAAEQSGLTETIENVGEEKKRFAMKYVQDMLEARGIFIDLNEIDLAIEAAVNASFSE